MYNQEEGDVEFKHSEAVRIFKALADDNRLEIMRILMSSEKCACELLDALEIGQSTLSHHMHILCDAGLVEAHKMGKWMFYSLSAKGSEEARALIKKYTLSLNQACKYKKCECCCSKKGSCNKC